MQQLEEDGGKGRRAGFRYADISKSVRSRGRGAWETRMETVSSSHRDEREPHGPKVVQLNLKSSLMGVHIMDDDEELFFSRRFSVPSMLSEKAKVDISRTPSGLLYPCANSGNSCQLNAALFTFDSNLEASEGSDNITEHILKKLVSQSRVSPVSTLDVPQSPTFSERSSFQATPGRRKSLRRRSDDAVAAVLDARPKNDLAQYLQSFTDDDEGPSEVAWLEPEDDNSYHPDLPVVEGYTSSKKKPTHERWSSNSSSWNLSIVQKPLRTVSTIVRRQHHTIPSRRRAKVDAIMTTSYDGRNRGSWFAHSGRRTSSAFACSGRFHMEVAAEPDLHEPDMAQANIRRAKVDEEDFPFENPIASSFVFQEADRAQQSRAHKLPEKEELLFSDNYHDLDDASLSYSEASSPHLDRRLQWLSSRRDSFGCVSGRSPSGFLDVGFMDVGRSGRFSVDLQRGQKLDKAQHPLTPDVRLRFFKTDKSSKRSILSPCLPFFHRSHHRHQQHVRRMQQAPVAGAGASSRRLQPLNSFTARLGPASESNSKLAAQFHLQ